MTVAGEFYLNFGWIGTVAGTFLFGAVLGIFWSRTAFWRDPYNVVGGAFGYYLLWTGFVGAADLQVIVTLIALYLIFATLSLVVRSPGASDPALGRSPSKRLGREMPEGA